MKAFRLALGTLTIVPVGELGELNRRDARAAMMLAPLAAAPLACAVALLMAVANWAQVPPLGAGFLVTGLLAYGTRAMHLDGLADTVDGFGAGWTRERAMVVMKSGDVGPMGVAAIVVSLGAQAACFGALIHAPVLAGAAVVVSRGACTVLASRRWGSARPEGLGALMAGSVPIPGVSVVVLASVSVLVATGMCAGQPWEHATAVALGASATMLLVLEWLGRRATRIIGGVSGDIFGAGVELSLTVVLVVLCLGGPR